MALAGEGDGALFAEVEGLFVNDGVVGGCFLWVVFAGGSGGEGAVGRVMVAEGVCVVFGIGAEEEGGRCAYFEWLCVLFVVGLVDVFHGNLTDIMVNYYNDGCISKV